MMQLVNIWKIQLKQFVNKEVSVEKEMLKTIYRTVKVSEEFHDTYD